MSKTQEEIDLIQSILNIYPFRNILVPCVCRSVHPFPAKPGCEFCQGTGKIRYGLAEVEVI